MGWWLVGLGVLGVEVFVYLGEYFVVVERLFECL